MAVNGVCGPGPAPGAAAGRRGVRLAFVAGGGAIKAYAFHVGVLHALEEDGFRFGGGVRWQPIAVAPRARAFDMYVGSSAGACVAASLASGRAPQVLGDAIRGTSPDVPTFGYRTLFVPVAPNPAQYVARLARRLRLRVLRPHHLLELGGVLTTSGVEQYFRRALPTNRFADLAVDLFITATQVNTSRKVVFGPWDSLAAAGDGTYDPACAYYDNVPISQAIAAAIAVPPLFVPYAITSPTSGKRFDYYDGEVRETLSAHIAHDAGADFVVASSIWHPYAYDERVGTLADLGMSAIAEQAIHQAVGQKVDRERAQARTFDELLRLLEAYGAEHQLPRAATTALVERVRELLGHRATHTLYVNPEPADHAFFFASSFRFNRPLIERCIDAGRRAYRAAARVTPEFFPALDAALAS